MGQDKNVLEEWMACQHMLNVGPCSNGDKCTFRYRKREGIASIKVGVFYQLIGLNP